MFRPGGGGERDLRGGGLLSGWSLWRVSGVSMDCAGVFGHIVGGGVSGVLRGFAWGELDSESLLRDRTWMIAVAPSHHLPH